MNVRSNTEDHDRYVTGKTTTIELIGVEFLLELNGGEFCVLASIINVTCASQWIKSQQVGRRLILMNKRPIVDRTTALL